MNKNTVRIKTLGLLVLAATLTAGCATTGQLDEVKKEAAAASAAAAAAQTAATAAQATAAQAQASASDANSCCQANTERLERAFKHSLRK